MPAQVFLQRINCTNTESTDTKNRKQRSHSKFLKALGKKTRSPFECWNCDVGDLSRKQQFQCFRLQKTATRRGVSLRVVIDSGRVFEAFPFEVPQEHQDPSVCNYRIFINPSYSVYDY